MDSCQGPFATDRDHLPGEHTDPSRKNSLALGW
jgi:hypothetical protein